MEEKYFSHEVYAAANQLTAIGGLMMALDGRLTDLSANEINAIGIILNNAGMELRDWNQETEEAQKKRIHEEAEFKRFRNYLQIKKDTEGAVLFFYVEEYDHYRLYFDDAYLGAQKCLGLSINMTVEGVPLCVIEPDEKQKYIDTITRLHMKVAICEEAKGQNGKPENVKIQKVKTTSDNLDDIEKGISELHDRLRAAESKSEADNTPEVAQ